MLSEREVHTDVRELLMSDRPFQFAHLIKFERPSRPDANGQVSSSAHKYAYLCDASRDVTFDDLTKNHLGVANGTQTYVANKVLAVSAIQENTEAKANSSTITLDGNGIGAAVSASVVVANAGANQWTITWPEGLEIVQWGFREGDKVLLSGQTNGSFNIVSFEGAGNVVRIKKIETDATIGNGPLSMSLASEEVQSILLEKNSETYASFINREVFIYRAYFENGRMVGATPDSQGRTGPILLFKGIISAVSFDDADDGIKVQWSLTSHWGDFAQVKGRVTSDDFHRALDANGVPQPYSAIKPIYAYDKGFIHSETSVNILANYTVQVEQQTIKTKKGFFGIGAKVKVKKYYVTENRYSPLDFQLQAKSIPLIYGVRNTVGMPIFADTLINDASTIYVAYALSEGEIGGIYDVYINGKSLICNNQADYEVRHAQNSENTIDVVCGGRADRGDVLGGVNNATGPVTNFYETGVPNEQYRQEMFRNILLNYRQYESPDYEETVLNQNASFLPVTYSSGKGITHGESVSITTPQPITLDFFAGREGQEAASQLVTIAQTNQFKLQNDFWKGKETSEYWGPNHRLLDTAYLVGKYKISEDDTNIPDLEFIIRGKGVECYNYDYSYAHDEKRTGESPDSFGLGDTVTIHNRANGAQLDTVEIIDKWKQFRVDGVQETRFRFNKRPNLSYNSMDVPAITSFYMAKGGVEWSMTTFNHVVHSDSVGGAVVPDVMIAPDAGDVIITFPTPQPTYPDAPLYTPIYSAPAVRDLLMEPTWLSTTEARVSFRYDQVMEQY